MQDQGGMMLKKSVVLVILLCFPIVFAETLNDAASLTLKTGLHFDVAAENGRIDKLIANISYFPREDERQELLKLEVNAGDETKVEKEDDTILIEWADVETDITFNIESVIANRVTQVTSEDTESVEKYLGSTRFINVDEEKIVSLAKEIVANEQDELSKVFKLASWTRENINYDLSSLNVEASLPALQVLESREGVCDEITILFISFVRSVGIPARYVSGLVYSESLKEKWVPHAWAEVFIDGKWIPFDVTLGQFAWLDPTHIKMKVSEDVDYSSIIYNWQSEAGSIKPNEMKVSSLVIESEYVTESPKIISVKPLFTEVYPGSFVPIEIEIENPTDGYLFDLITLKKGPGFFGSESVPVLLAAGEKKSYFLILKVPKDLTEEEYLTKVELKDRFDNRFAFSLSFGKKYRKISLEDARFFIRKITEEKTSDNIPEVRVDCLSAKDAYEEGEEAEVTCTLHNEGNKELDLEICLEEECESLNLDVKEKESVDWEVKASPQDINFKIKNEEKEKLIVSRAKIISSPGLAIEKLVCPETVGNDEKSKISVLLKTEEYVENAYLVIKGLEPYKIKDFKGTQLVVVPIRGSYFGSHLGEIPVYVAYNDAEGNRFETNGACMIEVTEVPFLSRITGRIKNFFKQDVVLFIARLD